MKPHILVIEDEASLVELLRYNLEKEGYRVSAANDGEVEAARIEIGGNHAFHNAIVRRNARLR